MGELELRKRVHAARVTALAGMLLWLLALLGAKPAAAEEQEQAAKAASLVINQAETALPRITLFVERAGQTPGNKLDGGQIKAEADKRNVVVAEAIGFGTAAIQTVYTFVVPEAVSLDASAFERFKSELQQAIGAIGANDEIAVVTYNETARELLAPTADKSKAKAALAGLRHSEGQPKLTTALTQALKEAAKTGTSVPQRKVAMIFAEDGAAFAMPKAEDELYRIAAQKGVSPYVVNMSGTDSNRPARQSFAELGGGAYAGTGKPIAETVQAIADRVRGGVVIRLTCDACEPGDVIKLREQGAVAAEFTLPGAAAPAAGMGFRWQQPIVIASVAAGCVLIGLAAGWAISRRRRRLSAAPAGSASAAAAQTAAALPTRQGDAAAARRIVPGNAQHIGARQEQQDAFGFSDFDDAALVRRFGTYAVLADGMGGLAMGRETSNLAVRAMLAELAAVPNGEPIPEALQRSVHRTNAAVYQLAIENGMEWNIGTTLLTAVIREGGLYWVSVGDSRIYLYRAGSLSQLTTDHVYARKLIEKVKQGAMSRAEAEQHPERHTLTSYLGIAEVQEIDQNMRAYPLRPGDCIMLCSDGLYGSVGEGEMIQCLEHGEDPQRAAELLVQAALSKGRTNQDNVTVAILAYR